MKIKMLAVVSTVAILSATQVFAETKAVTVQNTETTTSDVQRDVENAVENIKADTKEAYEDIKAYFVGNKEGASVAEVTYDSRRTANGMIGQTVHNAKEESVGKIQDIILDKNGNAKMVVIADGDIPGFEGKLVAMDYNLISVRNADGDVMAPLTEEAIDKAAEFSYDREDASDKVVVIPAEGISVAKLLEGQLVDAEMKSIAEVDNITLKNGHVTDIIVGFDKVLGMGGKKVALGYDDAKLVRVDEDEFDFQLSANQAVQFEAYKKVVTN